MAENIDLTKLTPVETFLKINKREFEMLTRHKQMQEQRELQVRTFSGNDTINQFLGITGDVPVMHDDVSLPTSTMDQFREQLNNPNRHIANYGIPGAATNTGNKIIKIEKNMIVSFSSDTTGCGHIRNIFLMTYLNAVFAKSKRLRTCMLPFFYYQHEVLMQARTLFFPRTMSEEYKAAVRRYKDMQPRYGYKMIYDIDDFVWNGTELGEKIPDYNFGSKLVPQNVVDTVVSIMDMMDTICVSTEFLKKYIIEKLRIKTPVIVLPNSVPRYFYGPNRRQPITRRLEKPKFIYTGSPTHYDNDNKLLGDFENAWLEYIIKNVKDKKIEFMVMGCHPVNRGLRIPWFFEPIKKEMHSVGWLNSYQYHLPILEYQPDFSIAPLVPNYFNYSKSDIKYIETCAFGAVFMGSTFTNGMPSPYDHALVNFPDNCTVSDIENRVNELCEPEAFNKVVLDQYEYLDREGRWLECEKYINNLTKIL